MAGWGWLHEHDVSAFGPTQTSYHSESFLRCAQRSDVTVSENWRIRSVEIQGRKTAYRVVGGKSGHPLVLLHAFGSNSDTWTRIATDLADAGFRVIAIDLPGHGRSDWLERYSLASMEDALRLALDQLGLHQFDLIGHSLGGHLALRIAARFPNRVGRLVVEAAPVPPRNEAEVEIMAREGPQPSLWRSIRLLGFKRLVRIVLLRQFDVRASSPILSELKSPMPDWWLGLDKISSQCLVVASPNDGLISSRAKHLTARLRNAQLKLLGTGHHLHTNYREAFLEVLIPFLRPSCRGEAYLPERKTDR